jgi:hypothetical protein
MTDENDKIPLKIKKKEEAWTVKVWTQDFTSLS